MAKILAYVSGIYPYSRKHSLTARRFARGLASKEELYTVQLNDSQEFIKKQIELDLDFISDGQFLWKDYMRPFSLSNMKINEENLEMMRRSDTNTFVRRPAINSLDDLKSTNLSRFLLSNTFNRSIKIYGPYTFANHSISDNFSIHELMVFYSQELAKTLIEVIKTHNIEFVEIAEPLLTEKIPDRKTMEHEKNCISIITHNLQVETNLSSPFNSMRPIWEDVIEFPIKGITLDMRSRDYFNSIPNAAKIVEDNSFLFNFDSNKVIILGCVNGRNGGLTFNKGLETPEWIVNVANQVRSKINNKIGITFSTDEVIIPRSIADKKLESIGKAKKILGD